MDSFCEISDVNRKEQELKIHQQLEALGKNIVKLRKAKGMTQEDLASACGWEAPNLRKIENARTNPTFKTLSIIADSLGCNLNDLFDV